MLVFDRHISQTMKPPFYIDIRPEIDYLVEKFKQQNVEYGTYEAVCKLYGNFASAVHIQDFFDDLKRYKTEDALYPLKITVDR